MVKPRVSNYTMSFRLNDEKYLLVNSLSGVRDVVDSEVVELLSILGKNDFVIAKESRKRIIEELKDKGYLTNRTEDEEVQCMQSLCELLHKKFSKYHDHIIIPTYNCNLRCIYCSQKELWGYEKSWRTKVLSRSEVDKLFDAIVSLDRDCPEDANKSIGLFGGEPLMPANMGIVEYILERGTKLGYKFRATTNGVALKQYAPLLERYQVEYVQVTVDGPKKVHDSRRIKANGKGSFDDIVLGIQAARENNIPVSIRVNADLENLEYLAELAEFIVSKEWNNDPGMRFFLCTVFEPSCTSDEYRIERGNLLDEIRDVHRKNPIMDVFDIDLREARIFRKILSSKKSFWPKCWGCGAVTSRFIYDPHGKIYTCFYPVGLEKLMVGTYLPSLSFNEQYELWRNRTIFNLPKCKQCKYSTLCGGGCAYFAYETNGDLYESSCDFFKQAIKYLPYLYELELEGKSSGEVIFSDPLFKRRTEPL